VRRCDDHGGLRAATAALVEHRVVVHGEARPEPGPATGPKWRPSRKARASQPRESTRSRSRG
jgi:hypothetical protein